MHAGRAAQRLEAVTGMKATTIHRLLGYAQTHPLSFWARHTALHHHAHLSRLQLAKASFAFKCRARGRGTKDLASRSDGDAESGDILGAFEYSAEHPLECDAVLVDEASMLDLPLAAALLAALPPHRRPQLVLVGVHTARVLAA